MPNYLIIWWNDFKKWFGGFERMLVIDNQASVYTIPIVSNVPITQKVNITPMPIPAPTVPNPDALPIYFDTPQHAYHAVRVLCDLAGLTLNEKNLICSCIYVESEFLNYKAPGVPTKHENLNKDGSLSSTDWGIVQVNDYFHISPTGQPFASVEAVLEDPESCVKWMIQMYLAGRLSMWDSYLSGEYKQYLVPTSPMWELAS